MMAIERIRLWLRSFVKSATTRDGRERVRRIRPGIEVLEDRIVPCSCPLPILVTSPTDDGTGQAGTLSAAINQVNNDPGTSFIITFAINQKQGVAATIDVSGQGEPAITEPVIISGYSQGGPDGASVPWVELKYAPGQYPPDVNGLSVNSGGVTIQGLAIDSFTGNGILLDNPAGSPGDTVVGDYIGTDVFGTASGLGNSLTGVVITGNNNTIGDLNGVIPTLVSGNSAGGISIEECSGNQVVSTKIGTDKTGLAPLPNQLGGGILLEDASNNTIGGPTVDGVDPGNVISGNASAGVILDGANNNQVSGNYIGLGRDGSTIVPNNGDGVVLRTGASGNTVGYNNAISGNTGNGVHVQSGAMNNLIIDDYIGTDAVGGTAKPNQGDGVFIDNTGQNTVGGGTVNDVSASLYNIISGNGGNGVEINGTNATQNLVAGNIIGTNYGATAAIPNVQNGIYLYQGGGNTIGAATAPSSGNLYSNLVSGNNYYGVEIDGSSNLVVNNYVGTDGKGGTAVANGLGGVCIGYRSTMAGILPPQAVPATNNTIGGTAAANHTLNLMSGNSASGNSGEYGAGIMLFGEVVQGTLIQGNYIGTDVSGLKPLGNQNDGIALNLGNQDMPTGTTIGGSLAGGGALPGAANVISANGAYGVGVSALAAGTGALLYNTIGFDATGNNLMKNQDGGDLVTGKAGWTVQGNREQ